MADAEMQQMVQLLQELQNPDNNARKAAETLYQQAKQNGADKLLVTMIRVLGAAEVPLDVRQHNANLLWRLVMRGPEKDFIFPKCEHKLEVASELLRLFRQEQDNKLRKKIGDVIVNLAEYVCDKDDPRGHLAPGGWPELLPFVFEMATLSTSVGLETCETAIRMLSNLLGTLLEDIIAAKAQFAAVLQQSLQHSSLEIRAAGVLLVLGVVTDAEKKDYKELVGTSGVVVQVLQHAVQAKDEDVAQELLQALTEVAQQEPDFFKIQLQKDLEPAKTFAGIAKLRGNFQDDGIRGLALEWLITYMENRTKWIKKNLPALPALVMEVCMEFMLEMDDGEEELKAWAGRMDDEEGDEDEDEVYHQGEEVIDRLVQACEFESLAQQMLALMSSYSQRNEWQAKHAVLAAIRQTVEYVEEKEHVELMAKFLIQNIDHPHARVRYATLHALGQMSNDQSPHFQEDYHKQVLPVLLQKMDDPVDKVAAMSMSAFVSFAEELDSALMNQYSHVFMQKLVGKLKSTSHRGVQEESITSIAVIAGNMEKDFSQYYAEIMPMMKQFVMTAKGSEQQRLRGKAFECMSLLGIAVGKEQFLPDAQEAMPEMLKSTAEADDVQREYIKEAVERVCQCLKKDFAMFVPMVLPKIFKDLRLEDDDSGTTAEDEYISMTVGEGKQITVHQTKFEELMQGLQLLYCFVDEMESAYINWVKDTADVLLPILSATDDASYLCDEARTIGLQVWALLIKCARTAATESGQQDVLTPVLLQQCMTSGFTIMADTNQEAETLSRTACGVTECVKNAGTGILKSNDVSDFASRIFTLIDASFERSRSAASKKKSTADLPKELNDEENDDDKSAEEEEEQCRRNFEEMLGAVMQVAPAEFAQQCLQVCGQRMEAWIGVGQRVLALYLACDLISHLRENSTSVWPVIMPEVFRSMGDADSDIATAAVYAVNVASPIAAFAEAAPEAFRRLATIVNGKKPKRTDHKGKLLFDNAVAALFMLAKNRPECCPAEVQAWSLVVSKLPLTQDEDEAQKIHQSVVELLQAQHAGILGPNQQNLGQLLSVLAEVYRNEKLANKQTEEGILAIFRALPKEMLLQLAGTFTEKQQKKIEKMLSS